MSSKSELKKTLGFVLATIAAEKSGVIFFLSVNEVSKKENLLLHLVQKQIQFLLLLEHFLVPASAQ